MLYDEQRMLNDLVTRSTMSEARYSIKSAGVQVRLLFDARTKFYCEHWPTSCHIVPAHLYHHTALEANVKGSRNVGWCGLFANHSRQDVQQHALPVAQEDICCAPRRVFSLPVR